MSSDEIVKENSRISLLITESQHNLTGSVCSFRKRRQLQMGERSIRHTRTDRRFDDFEEIIETDIHLVPEIANDELTNNMANMFSSIQTSDLEDLPPEAPNKICGTQYNRPKNNKTTC